MTQKFDSLDELFKKYHWRTESKFVPLAKRYGFDPEEAKKFLKKSVVHDVKVPKAKFLPIVSKHPNAFQFDTFINQKQKGGLNYLMFININTRKAYAYPIEGKGSKVVLEALQKFCNEVQDVYSLTSDQDAAYLSNDVLEFIKSKNIVYRTTVDTNHNVLGIINRFMRTIRDMVGENRYINEKEMNDLINEYNESPHKSLQGKAPNDITEKDELEYIQTKSSENPYDFKPNDKVQVVLEKEPFGKNRRNVSENYYIIKNRKGNLFKIKSKDESVDLLPGYQLIKTKNKNLKLADTIKKGKRGDVEFIESYDSKKNKYKVVYEGGVTDKIPPRNLRESAPAKLSSKELEYWSKQKSVPDNIKKWE